jgi:N-acetylglucosaminyldiphosphoundecaprenol N-acetyl-beta-D-mannosaminyltransferase
MLEQIETTMVHEREPRASVPSRHILGMRVDATHYDECAEQIVRWGAEGTPRYVCIASVNNVMEAHDSLSFRHVMNSADLVTPDGMPLVWGLRRLGVAGATRVYGPDLTPKILSRAAARGIPVGLYGGTDEILTRLEGLIATRWPGLRVAYRWSPPFRALTKEEDRQVVEDIRSSGAEILLVAIGCPRQEIWMYEHRDRLPLVQVGVGAAFDFLAGEKKQAPALLQRNGLEWLFRLATEPRRLWKRYLRHNPRFVFLFGKQLLGKGDVPARAHDHQ